MQQLIYTESLVDELRRELGAMEPDKVFCLTDENVERSLKLRGKFGDEWRVIPAGEGSKSLEMAMELWRWLSENGATRHSVLINVGGGVITDLGGFVAATFKRGIRFVNVPTTLLGASDAAIGGKTGIDFMGLKNEIGAFSSARRVIVAPELLETLPERELRSGFAEVVKMAMLSDAGLYRALLEGDALTDRELMARATLNAASEKMRIVAADPYEENIRKRLNFGHTAGHAYEACAARKGMSLSHGEAVAHGILRALEESRDRLGLAPERVEEYRKGILERYYGELPFGEEARGEIEALMAHDKKNRKTGEIGWVLLKEIADPVIM